MDAKASSKFLFLLLLSFIFLVCSSGSFLSYQTRHDFTNPPFTAYPTTVTNPVTTPATGATTPPDTKTPPLTTGPPANPSTETPFPSTTDPINSPVPVTNPVTTPSTTTFSGGQPYPTTPVVTNPAAAPPQSWCVAKGGLPDSVIQSALDYACGIGGADCSGINQGASCYNPNTLQNHASYAFNNYYQRNPSQNSCDFGGVATITNTNPSSGSCIFPTASSSSASPATTTPTPTQFTDSSFGSAPAGSGSPPTVMNPSNPTLGGGGLTEVGEMTPPSASISSSLKPFIGCIAMAVSIIGGRIVHGV